MPEQAAKQAKKKASKKKKGPMLVTVKSLTHQRIHCGHFGTLDAYQEKQVSPDMAEMLLNTGLVEQKSSNHASASD